MAEPCIAMAVSWIKRSVPTLLSTTSCISSRSALSMVTTTASITKFTTDLFPAKKAGSLPRATGFCYFKKRLESLFEIGLLFLAVDVNVLRSLEIMLFSQSSSPAVTKANRVVEHAPNGVIERNILGTFDHGRTLCRGRHLRQLFV